MSFAMCIEVTESLTIIFYHLPPFSLIKLTTCCCWVRCNAVRNLSHCSSEVRRSSKASFSSYAVLLSLRTFSYCLLVITPRLSSWSSSPKSGSIMSDNRYFNLAMQPMMESDVRNASSGIITLLYSVRLSKWIKKQNSNWIILHNLTAMFHTQTHSQANYIECRTFPFSSNCTVSHQTVSYIITLKL